MALIQSRLNIPWSWLVIVALVLTPSATKLAADHFTARRNAATRASNKLTGGARATPLRGRGSCGAPSRTTEMQLPLPLRLTVYPYRR